MRDFHLPVLILKHVAFAAVQNSHLIFIQRSGMMPGMQPITCGLNTDQTHLLMRKECME